MVHNVLAQFARAERLEASQVTAVGVFERATVGWFDRAAKQYRRIPVDEQCEVLSRPVRRSLFDVDDTLVDSNYLHGLSRMYRGEHHPTDILASLLFGALWLTATVWLIKPNADGPPGRRERAVDRPLTRPEPSPSREVAGPR